VALIRAQLQARVTLDEHHVDVAVIRLCRCIGQRGVLTQKLIGQNGHEERRHI
jgi:hypothetical protein